MNEKFAITKKAGIYGMIGNLFLLIIKAIGWEGEHKTYTSLHWDNWKV